MGPPRSGPSGSRVAGTTARSGFVTNLAFRLCGEAQAGQILTTSRVLTTINGLVDAEALGDLPLKGFSSPVPTFNILQLRAVPTSRL